MHQMSFTQLTIGRGNRAYLGRLRQAVESIASVKSCAGRQAAIEVFALGFRFASWIAADQLSASAV